MKLFGYTPNDVYFGKEAEEGLRARLIMAKDMREKYEYTVEGIRIKNKMVDYLGINTVKFIIDPVVNKITIEFKDGTFGQVKKYAEFSCPRSEMGDFEGQVMILIKTHILFGLHYIMK